VLSRADEKRTLAFLSPPYPYDSERSEQNDERKQPRWGESGYTRSEIVRDMIISITVQ